MSSVLTLSECESVSTVTSTTDCLRHYVRIYRLSYYTANSLDHWGIDDRELGYLYHCNLSCISSHRPYAHWHARAADKADNNHQAIEWYLGAVGGRHFGLRSR